MKPTLKWAKSKGFSWRSKPGLYSFPDLRLSVPNGWVDLFLFSRSRCRCEGAIWESGGGWTNSFKLENPTTELIEAVCSAVGINL